MKNTEIKTRVDRLRNRYDKNIDISKDLEILSLELELSIVTQNQPKRKINPKRKSLVMQATKLKKQGLSVRDIAMQLGISKSTVGRWTKPM